MHYFKPNFLRLLLTILTCFVLTKCFCQKTSVSGLVLDLTTKKPLTGAKIDLLFKLNQGNIIVATTLTDTAGSFVFQNINPQEYSLSCFYKMPLSKTTYLPKEILETLGRNEIDSNFTLVAGQNYYHLFYLLVTCPYDKTKDQDYCPICKKKDMIQPILWGLPIIDRDGNWVGGDNIDDYYLGGCEPDMWCNPTKHCNRCTNDF